MVSKGLKFINKHMLLFVLLAIFLFMFLLNTLTPLVWDDYGYAAKTRSIGSIFADEYQQYMTWTGRSVVHVILRFFAKLPKVFFNVFNSLVFTGLLYQIMSISKVNKTKSDKGVFFKYLFVFALIWNFIPNFADVILWMSGAVNYLVGMVILLSFIVVYHRYTISEHHEVQNKWPKIIALFLLGVIAGWTNETASGGTLLIIMGYMLIVHFFNKQKVPMWMYAGAAGNFIGLLFLVLAPGNALRSVRFERSKLSFVWKVIDGLPGIATSLRENASFILIVGLSLLIFACLTKRFTLANLISLVFYIGGIMTLGALVLSPTGIWWYRSYFGGVIFIIISVVISVFDLFKYKESVSQLVISFVYGYVMIMFISFFATGCMDIYRNYVAYNEQYQSINRQIEEGKKDVVVSQLGYSPKTRYAILDNDDISPDKNNYRNKIVAQYWGAESIRSE